MLLGTLSLLRQVALETQELLKNPVLLHLGHMIHLEMLLKLEVHSSLQRTQLDQCLPLPCQSRIQLMVPLQLIL